jgi:hypothetical protein
VLPIYPIKGLDGHRCNRNGHIQEKNMWDEFADTTYEMPIVVKIAFVKGHDLPQVSPSRKLKKNILVAIFHESRVSMRI